MADPKSKSIADALVAIQSTQPVDPRLLPNPALEQQVQAQPQAVPVNPMVQAIMQKLGLMNLIRNRTNTNMSGYDL